MQVAPGSPRVKVKAGFLVLFCTYSSLLAFPPQEHDGDDVSVPSCLFSSDD